MKSTPAVKSTMPRITATIALCSAVFLSTIALMAQEKRSAERLYLENKGQIGDQNGKPNKDVRYLVVRPGLNIQLRDNGFSYDSYVVNRSELPLDSVEHMLPRKFQVRPSEEIAYHFHRVDIELVGAHPKPTITATGASQDYLNYYTHITEQSNGEQGATGVRGFERVTYHDVWPKIDIEWFLDEAGNPEYQFIVRPGGNVASIQWRYHGADSTSLAANSIFIHVKHGPIAETLPRSYVQGTGREIDVLYRTCCEHQYGLSLASIDMALTDETLVIDPIPELKWATFYGGDSVDVGRAVAVTSVGDIVMAGSTRSRSAIATAGSHQITYGGNDNLYSIAFGDAFLAMFTSAGARKWGTYYGGDLSDVAHDVAVTSSGDIVMTGMAVSANGIATVGSHQQAKGLYQDAFVAAFTAAGVRKWATYYGGESSDIGTAVEVTPADDILIAGSTGGINAISTAGSHQVANGGNGDGFLAVFTSAGARKWGTYYGGSGQDWAMALAVSSAGDIALAGYTESTNAIATAGSHQPTYGGARDAFLAVFTNAGVRRWGTYYGGSSKDGATDENNAPSLAVTPGGDIVITGETLSANAISTAGSHQTTIGGGSDAFLAVFTGAGVRRWGTYYGGASKDLAHGLAVTSAGDIVVAGQTESSAAISTSGSHQPNLGGWVDAFLTLFSDVGIRRWGTYYGGPSYDRATDLALTLTGDYVLSGETISATNIATSGSHQSMIGGNYDGFLAVFTNGSLCTPPGVTIPNGDRRAACQSDITSLGVSAGVNTSFRWTPPSKGSVVSGTVSDSAISVRWSSSGIDTVRVRVWRSSDTTCYRDTIIVVTINALPTPVISGATSVCDDSRHVYRLPSNVGRMYAWQTSASGSVQGSSAADSVVVSWRRVGSGPDTLRVRETVVASGCSKDTLLVVQVQPRPTPMITGPSTLCDGGTAVYSTPQIAGRAYAWRVSSRGSIQGSSTSDNISAQWSNAGSGLDTVFLRETNVATGCAKDTLLVVRVNALPAHVITGTASTCAGKLESYTVSNASSSNLRWTLPSNVTLVSGTTTSSTITLRWEAAGTFDLKVQATAVSTGCTKDTVLRVSAGQSPNVGVTGAASVCLSDGKGKVYSVEQGVSGTQYAWTVTPASRGSIVSGASTNQVTIDWLQRGTATLRASVTGPTGCTRDSLLAITVEDSLRPTITSASGFAMCQGDSLRLDAGSGYASYTWYEGTTVVGTARYYTTTKAARYVVQVSNGGCSGSSTAITTTVNALPTVTVSESPAGTLLATTNAGQAQYQWYNAATTPWTPLTGATQATYAPATSGTYGVDVTNTTTGCVSRSTAYTITIGPPPADPVVTAVQSAITVCRGYTANARVVITGGKPPYRITWTLAGTGTVLNRDVDYILVPMTTDGVLRCSVIDANDRSDSADIAITVVPVPTVQISQVAPDRLLANCDNPAATYQWYTVDSTGWRVIAGATQQSYSPANDGQFGVEASTECTVRSSSFTFVAPPPQKLVVNDYDFGSLPVDDLINASGGHVGSVQVYNRTGIYLELTGASTDDTSTFVVPQQWPRRMNDGDTAEIAVRFVPQDKRAYTTKLNVTTNTTYSGTGTITGTGRDLLPDERVTQVILRPTRSEVEPGDTISVMLMVSVERPVQTAGAAGRYLSTIQWDYRVLEPLPSPGMGYDTSGTYAVANVSNGFRQQNQVQLYRFRFRAKQAEVDSTSIIFSGAKGFVWQDDRKAYPALVDSVVRVRVCRDGGPQLIGRMLTPSIVRATPSPARNVVDVELQGPVAGTLELSTADGRRVISRIISEDTKRVQLDLSALGAGIYTIALTTPRGVDHVPLIVVP